MQSAPDRFLEKLRSSLADTSFVKLTLSSPRGAEPGLRNVYARLVALREGPRLSLLRRYATRDATENFPVAEGAAALAALIGETFIHAHLFTTTGDWRLDCIRGTLKASRPVFSTPPEAGHDRRKVKALAPLPYLTALGVTNPEGEARPGMGDKLRQIERFTELLGHLLAESPLRDRRELRLLDLGAGKGYLTFAAHAFLRARGIAAEVTGIEQREELVALANGVARTLACEGLTFARGTIGDFTPPAPPDILIALHACDTATDDALHLGIRAGAQLLLAAPCCHQELRPQLTPPPLLRDILRHGILAEREADILTDGIRAQLLEIHGYDARVFEFISPEHTAKNLLIAAHRRPQPPDAAPLRARLCALLEHYSIREQRLARLLGELG